MLECRRAHLELEDGATGQRVGGHVHVEGVLGEDGRVHVPLGYLDDDVVRAQRAVGAEESVHSRMPNIRTHPMLSSCCRPTGSSMVAVVTNDHRPMCQMSLWPRPSVESVTRAWQPRCSLMSAVNVSESVKAVPGDAPE